MKIGIFDSGLGGLVIARAIVKKLPKYDYIYLGDTKNLPYGQKSPVQIYRFTLKAVDFLFKQKCQIIIIACNTASALALRKIQQQYLPTHYPNRRVLGVIIPTLESIWQPPIDIRSPIRTNRRSKVGVIGTTATIKSHIYKKELTKINGQARIIELVAPDLVPLIEQNSLQKARKTVKLYLRPFKKRGIEALILGCTHYPILKKTFGQAMGRKVTVISQDEIMPGKLVNYLKRHKELASKLSKNSKKEFWVTSRNSKFDKVAKRMFGRKLDLKLVKI
ncbi:MAG: glutamate racemase [Patescibacteria group bacterium]